MGLTIIGVVIVAALLISSYTIRWTVMDYKKQKEFLEGQEYRRTQGLFDVGQYMNSQKAIKEPLWIKQKNTGIDPGTFNKKLLLIDYFEENGQLVINKGSIK